MLRPPLRRKGVVALADKPVACKPGAARWSATAIGDVHRYHIAEYVFFSVVCGNVFSGFADHCPQFDLPVGAITAVRNDDLSAIADNSAPTWFDKQIRYAAFLAPKSPRFPAFLVSARFVHMAVEIDGRVENDARIHDRRQRANIHYVVNIVRTVVSKVITRNQMIDDFV